ncbi:MAG: integrating conjugative element protein [Candidatus Sedimenticola sp. (ex Thyasira tokunagai)]
MKICSYSAIRATGILLLAGSLVCVQAQAATPAPIGDSSWYYEIGGAQPLTSAPNPLVNTVTIGGSGQLGLNYSCGKFDPVLGVTNTLNNIKSGVDQMMNQMVTAATSAIAALPALILQRANPGLYDMFQNALLKAEETVNLATKSCEQMEAEIAQGKNPFDEWVVLSKGNDWKVQMGAGGMDVVSARDNVETNTGNNGLPWLGGGNAGGAAQAPIRIIGDTAKAGFNIIMNRQPHAAGAVPVGPTSPPITRIWNSPAAASAWIVRVTGDKTVRTCEGCAREATPGVGLAPEHHVTRTATATDLQNLVSGATPITLSNLDQVSGPGVAITRQVIDSIRKLPTAEQGLIIDRLAGDVALVQVMEKALYARRLLTTGRREPNIAAGPEDAQREINQSLAALDTEIESLLFETRVRKEVIGKTVLALLKHESARRAASGTTGNTRTTPAKRLEGGAPAP